MYIAIHSIVKENLGNQRLELHTWVRYASKLCHVMQMRLDISWTLITNS